jgi:hypothetical protein
VISLALILAALLSNPAHSVERGGTLSSQVDCLADLCLGDPFDPSLALISSLVTVSERKWARKATVCSGVVVAIEVTTGWTSFKDGRPNWPLEDVPLSAVTRWGSHDEPRAYYDGVLNTLQELGWESSLSQKGNPDIPLVANYRSGYLGHEHHSAQKVGIRYTFYSYSIVRSLQKGASMTVTTVHPDYNALCAPERQQGL